MDNGDGSLTLSAPASNFYEWSTGEDSQSIVVSDTGMYMVWIDHGIGMLGSQPFHLQDLENDCIGVGIEEALQERKQSLGIFDLLGRRCLSPLQTGVIYVERFTDGSQVKKIQLD